MKSYRSVFKILAALLAAILTVSMFSSCDTNTNNGTGDPDGDLSAIANSKPVFTNPGGFFEGKSSVRIIYPNNFKEAGYTIRITYDGSEPTKTSRLYNGGDISLPKKGMITKFTGIGGNASVTVIRAAYFDSRGQIVGKIATATFFSLENADRFKGLPVIALTTDPVNLTGEKGIFTNAQMKGKEWERPCNVQYFDEEGTLVLSQDGGIRLFGGSSRGLSQKSLKIYARKSKDFGTDVYDGAGKFKYPLFGEDRKKADGTIMDGYDSFILRNGGNDSLLTPTEADRATFIRDGIANVIAGEAAPELMNMNYKPVVVFLNGEYYGLLNMREHENDNTIRNDYNIADEDKDNICVISSELDTGRGKRYDGTWFYYVQDDGPEGELEAWQQLLLDIRNGKYTYEEVRQLIDVDGFMKYCAVNLFLCNTDWPHNNVKVWRYCGDGEGALDGRWRFVFKDMDLGLGRYTIGNTTNEEGDPPLELYTKADSENFRLMLCNYLEFDRTSGYPDVSNLTYVDTLGLQGLLAFLLKNSGFRADFGAFCNKLATEIWPCEKLEKLITDSADKIKTEMRYYLQKRYFGNYRFDFTTDYDTWNDAIFGEDDSLITWARERSGADGFFLKEVNELLAMFKG